MKATAKIGLSILSVILLALGLFSYFYVIPVSAVDVSACGDLTTANAVYVLTANVSSAGTCFNILADNITIDGAGFTVNYSQSVTGYGVNITSRNNITVKNLNVVQGNSSVSNAYGIYGKTMTNSSITNNNITTSGSSGFGIYFDSSSTNTLSNNNVTTSGSAGYGVYLFSSISNNVSNNTITTLGDSGYGLYLQGSSNNILTNNVVITSHTTFSPGIYLRVAYNNTVLGGSIISKLSNDYYLETASTTNNFTNTNFTAARRINFVDATSYFNYNNETNGNIWLKTNVSAQSSLNRTLVTWSQSTMKWNDTNGTAGLTARYSLLGLSNGGYEIYNLSVGTRTKSYVLGVNTSGILPSFTIGLNGNTEISVEQVCAITNSGSGSCTYGSSCVVDGGTVTMNGTCNFTVVNITGTGTLTHPQLYGLNLIANNLTILSGGKIDVSNNGYAGGAAQSSGDGPGGGGTSFNQGGGGGHGGEGGNNWPGVGGGISYDIITIPNELGSGGGGGYSYGGAGGGLIKINISDTLTNNGSIAANGQNGPGGYNYGGGGAGGTIYISAGTFAGSGTMTVNGGNGEIRSGYGASGSGGGGRIAVYYTSKTYTGTTTAYGGTGYPGGAGTIYIKPSSQTYGDLIVDNGGNSGASTPLNSSAYSTAFGNMTIRSGAIVTSVLATLPLNATTMTGNGLISMGSNNLVLRTTNISMDGGSIISTSGEINITFTNSITASNFNTTLSTANAVRIFYGSTGLSTGFPAQSTITRTFAAWSGQQMKWNDTNGTAGITANYNLTGLLANRAYNVANSSSTGSYSQILAADSNGNLPSFNIFLIANTEINAELVPLPQWSANASSKASPQTYVAANNYGFQINWTAADNNFANASFQLGRPNGGLANYTISSTPATNNNSAAGPDVWYVNLTQDHLGPAGAYNYTWFGTDIYGAQNKSDTVDYAINKAATSARLFLSGTEGNKNYNLSQTANFTVSINITGKTARLDTNLSGWGAASGASPLFNYTQLQQSGIFNITGYFSGDENYSVSSATYFANVTAVIGNITLNFALHLGSAFADDLIQSANKDICISDTNGWFGLTAENPQQAQYGNLSTDYNINVSFTSDNKAFLAIGKGGCTNFRRYVADVQLKRFLSPLIAFSYAKTNLIQLILQFNATDITNDAHWGKGNYLLSIANQGYSAISAKQNLGVRVVK